MKRVSAIISTYNRSGYLRGCIASLEMQTRLPDEVVIADDGSAPEHVDVIEEIIGTSPLKIVHARQEHSGFRLAASRNNGVRHSTGDYLFFSDGDVLFFPDVLERHVDGARQGVWTTGSGVWLTEEETARVSPEHVRERRLEELGYNRSPASPAPNLPVSRPQRQVGRLRRSRTVTIEELWPPDDDERLRLLRRAHARFRRKSFWARLLPIEFHLRKVRMLGLQTSLCREDFEMVNGFDESFVGWGREDDDLSLRLSIAGVRGRSVVLTARALHRFHPTEPRTGKRKGRAISANNDYHNRPRRGRFRCELGLDNPKPREVRQAPPGKSTA